MISLALRIFDLMVRQPDGNAFGSGGGGGGGTNFTATFISSGQF